MPKRKTKVKPQLRSDIKRIVDAPTIPGGLDVLEKRVWTLFANETSGHYEMGQIYNQVLNDRMAEKEGFASGIEYFKQKFGEAARSSLERYGSVANEYGEEMVKEHTMTKLAQLIVYYNARKESLPEDPGPIPIKVPGKNGIVEQKMFKDCTVKELVKATKLLAPPPEPMPAPEASTLETMHDALRAALGHTSKVELRASFDRNNGTMLTLANVKMWDFEKVTLLLASAMKGQAAPRQGQPLRAVPRR